MKAITQYSCRYITPDRLVYAIVSKKGIDTPLHRAAIMSTDFRGSGPTPARVLVAVSDPIVAHVACRDVEHELIETTSKDFAYIAELMKMPSVVILDAVREEDFIFYELHYVSPNR